MQITLNNIRIIHKITIYCIVLLLSIIPTAQAIKTQTNKVTDLFDHNIDKEFIHNLQNQDIASKVRDTSIRAMLEGSSYSDSKVKELNSIRVTDLPNAGRTKRIEHKFYDEYELEPDYTKSGNKMHKRDAERISNASNKVMSSLFSKLKDIGIDCHTVKGPTHEEPIFTIKIKQEPQKNTQYNQFFCEEPRNKYNCTDSRILRCIRPSSTPELLSITTSNFKHQVKGNMMYMDHHYNTISNGYSRTSSGMFRTGSLFGSTKRKTISACTAHLTMTFSIKNDLSTIAEFALLNLVYTGPVMIKLNNQLVHSYPYNTNHLSFNHQYHETVHKTGSFLRRTKYVTHHPMVNINGESKLLSDYTHRFRHGNINLKPFLRQGKNELQITAVSLNQGQVTAQMRSMKKLCLQWQETWDERCVIR